jgi:hypothetical protein
MSMSLYGVIAGCPTNHWENGLGGRGDPFTSGRYPHGGATLGGVNSKVIDDELRASVWS